MRRIMKNWKKSSLAKRTVKDFAKDCLTFVESNPALLTVFPDRLVFVLF